MDISAFKKKFVWIEQITSYYPEINEWIKEAKDETQFFEILSIFFLRQSITLCDEIEKIKDTLMNHEQIFKGNESNVANA